MISNRTLHKIAITSIIISLLGITTACENRPQSTVESTQAASLTEQPALVSAEAFVVPLQEANLSFKTSGQIIAVAVEEGDAVAEGQPLARLDDSAQQISLAQTEAKLENAQANLTETKAGPTAEQIAQAEAGLAKAEAYLAQLLAGPTTQEIAEAEAKVKTAQANLNQVLAGSRDEEVQAAAAKMLQAEAEVREAQADYDANVYGDLDRLGPFGLALEQATLSYEAAKADYEKLVNGSTDEEIAISQAQLNEAQIGLEKVLAGSTAEQIAQAQADVVKAEASLAELKAGATAEQIAVVETNVKSAEIDVAQAQLDLDNTQLTAPFDGAIGQLNLNEGEMVSASTGVISLADMSGWRVETDDLNEIDVVGVEIGSPVTFTVDALPNDTFKGVVIRITPKSEIKSGDVTYTVLIDITEGNTEALRWGMTAFVDIDIAPDL